MFTCSVSVYSLFAVSLRLLLLSTCFATLQCTLFLRFDLRFVCSIQNPISLCVCFFFHKGKIILSVNMSVCVCDHNSCVFVFSLVLVCVTWEYRYLYEMYQPMSGIVCVLSFFCSREKRVSLLWERRIV